MATKQRTANPIMGEVACQICGESCPVKRSNRKTKHFYYHCSQCRVSPGANNYSEAVNEYILNNARFIGPASPNEPGAQAQGEDVEVIDCSIDTPEKPGEQQSKKPNKKEDEAAGDAPGILERFLIEVRQFIFGGW